MSWIQGHTHNKLKDKHSASLWLIRYICSDFPWVRSFSYFCIQSVHTFRTQDWSVRWTDGTQVQSVQTLWNQNVGSEMSWSKVFQFQWFVVILFGWKMSGWLTRGDWWISLSFLHACNDQWLWRLCHIHYPDSFAHSTRYLCQSFIRAYGCIILC